MAHQHTCRGCEKSFAADTDLWRHLRASLKPVCRAEFQRLYREEHFPGIQVPMDPSEPIDASEGIRSR